MLLSDMGHKIRDGFSEAAVNYDLLTDAHKQIGRRLIQKIKDRGPCTYVLDIGMGTGDFTHPDWLRELKGKLEQIEYGIYKHKDTFYILTCEVSNIYFKRGRTRKIHNILFAPSFEIADEINKLLSADLRVRIAKRLKSLGFTHIALDLLGYRPGTMLEGK